MFLKNRNISSKIKRSKVTDYAALICGYLGGARLHPCFGAKITDVEPMSVSIFPPQSFCTRLSTSRDGGQCCGFFKTDLLCSDQFSLEDDLILSQIADMAEDDMDQIMCSQVQTLETQYWNDIELSQTVSEMLSGLPASPDVNCKF